MTALRDGSLGAIAYGFNVSAAHAARRQTSQHEVIVGCPAPVHNSLRAATGRSKRHMPHAKCVCPYALEVAQRDADNRKRHDTNRVRTQPTAGRPAAGSVNSGPMMYIGGGPWALNPECPAQWHNTQRAAVGRSRNGPQKRCVCPQALALLAIEREKRRANDNGRRDGRSKKMTTIEAAMLVPIGTVPDFSKSACRTVMGRKLYDAITSFPLPEGAIAAHRTMCGSCPIRNECAADAIRNEKDGEQSWDGMYGGLMPAERKKARALMNNGAI